MEDDGILVRSFNYGVSGFDREELVGIFFISTADGCLV